MFIRHFDGTMAPAATGCAIAWVSYASFGVRSLIAMDRGSKAGASAVGALIAELAPAWLAQQESRLRERRGRDRLRAEGAGPGHDLPFADRVIATLVILRFQLPHAALAVCYRVHRCTITRAVGEIRPLLAARGFAVPGNSGLRMRTLADVFAYAAADGVRLRIDGTEVQVRRPPAGRPGRRAFISGKKKQNTIKATAVSDGQGRCCGWAHSGPAACTTDLPRFGAFGGETTVGSPDASGAMHPMLWAGLAGMPPQPWSGRLDVAGGGA
jgi:hypothetical protein